MRNKNKTELNKLYNQQNIIAAVKLIKEQNIVLEKQAKNEDLSEDGKIIF